MHVTLVTNQRWLDPVKHSFHDTTSTQSQASARNFSMEDVKEMATILIPKGIARKLANNRKQYQ